MINLHSEIWFTNLWYQYVFDINGTNISEIVTADVDFVVILINSVNCLDLSISLDLLAFCNKQTYSYQHMLFKDTKASWQKI